MLDILTSIGHNMANTMMGRCSPATVRRELSAGGRKRPEEKCTSRSYRLKAAASRMDPVRRLQRADEDIVYFLQCQMEVVPRFFAFRRIADFCF